MGLKLFNTDDYQPLQKDASLSVQLSNPAEEWEQEVLDYAFRLHPWLSEFSLTVDFTKKMPDRRYGLGGITVSAQQPLVPATKSRSPFTAANQQEIVLAHIPVVIKDGTLAPLDVFISDNDVLPLEEDTFRKRIGGALDARSTSPSRSDPTLIGHLWPPGRSSFGGPGAEMGLSVLNKFSSLDEPSSDATWLLRLSQVGEDDVEEMKEASGYPLCNTLVSGKCRIDRAKTADLIESVSGSSYLSSELGQLIQTVVGSLPPDRPARGSVAQLTKSADGLEMRTTDPNRFSLDPGMRVDVDGDPGVFTNLAPTARRKEADLVAGHDPVEYGTAYVLDGTKTRKGVLFTNVHDFTGEKIAGQLFTDFERANWGLEPRFAIAEGVKVAEIRTDPIGGTGVFVFSSDEGTACTVPVTVHELNKSASGPVYKATVHTTKLASELPLDTDVKLYISTAVTKPVYTVKTSSLVIPAGYNWMSIGDDRFRPFAPLRIDHNVVAVGKIASNAYTIEGGPVDGVIRGPLGLDDTELTLAAIGVPVEEIPGVIKDAEDGVDLVDCRTLRLRQEPVASLPPVLDTELLKSAAAVSDPNTVDAVLGLNMMDTDTEDNFMIMAQNLEMAQQKVARLLLMSRLGMRTIPEGAAKIVMTRLTPIIDSLKVLAMQNAYGG